MPSSRPPGEVRDAIIDYLRGKRSATVDEIFEGVSSRLHGTVPRSSVRSYLQLNEGKKFVRVQRGVYRLIGK
jgi:hypothetical protein